MGNWEANSLRDLRADGLLALGGWPGECPRICFYMLLLYLASADTLCCRCAAEVVLYLAEASSSNLGMFFDERFVIPVPDDLIEEVVFPFLPRYKQWVWPCHPQARHEFQR
jgi:hypothetical protein